MNHRYALALLSACLLLPASTLAQDTLPSHCPDLPGGSNLQWDQQQRDGYLLCRAIDDNQHNAFNLMLTQQEPDLRLARSLRAEKAQFADQSIHWYRMDLADDSGEASQFRRITVSRLGKDQYAQLWFNAGNPSELQTRIEQVGALRLHGTVMAGKR